MQLNTLSLIIYFASVSTSVVLLLIVISIVLIIAYIAYVTNEKAKFKYKYVPFIAVVLIFLSALIPSEKTIYLIAASELSEKVYNSSEGQQIANLIKNWLKKNSENISK